MGELFIGLIEIDLEGVYLLVTEFEYLRQKWV